MRCRAKTDREVERHDGTPGIQRETEIIYGKYDAVLTAVVKFAVSVTAFWMLNDSIGYMEKLENPVVWLSMSWCCSFLPYSIISFGRHCAGRPHQQRFSGAGADLIPDLFDGGDPLLRFSAWGRVSAFAYASAFSV